MTSRVSFPSRRRGVALIIILAILVIATILVVGFTVSMRTERSASASMANNERAKLLSQSALEHAISLLDSNIPQPIPPGAPFKPGDSGYAAPTNWIVNPGLLTLVTGPSTVREVPLSSNPSAAYVPSGSDANLNLGSFSGTTYAILGNDATPLRAAWINILKDPLSPAGPSNPIVGRYAFWMDDENAKINLNTAYGKPARASMHFDRVNPLDTLDFSALQVSPMAGAPPASLKARPDGTYKSEQMSNTVGSILPRYYPLWHPSAVNLDLLGNELDCDVLADWIHNGGSWRYLSSPEEVQQFVNTNAEQFLENHKFQLTTSGRAPEFNVFGKPRLMLEKWISPGHELKFFQTPEYDAQGPTYFHAFETSNTKADPKTYRDLTAIHMVADAISDLLARNDWPGMPQRSFVDKWGGDEKAKREADQVAWNIVAMGNYAVGDEGTIDNSAELGYGWPEQKETAFRFLQNNPIPNAASGVSPITAKVSNRTVPTDPQKSDPNLFLCLGKLSQKAVLPFYPRPLVNEVCLKILPEPMANNPGKYRLRMWLELEFYNGRRFSPNDVQTSWPVYFKLTSFEYTVSDDVSTISQSGRGHALPNRDSSFPPFIKHLAGSAGDLGGTPNPIPPDSFSFVVKTNEGDKENDGTPKVDGRGNPINALYIYPRSGADFSGKIYKTNDGTKENPVLDPAVAGFSGNVTITAQMRIAVHVKSNILRPSQLIPIWDDSDGSPALSAPGGEDDVIALTGSFNVDLLAGQVISRSLEVADARTGAMSRAWREIEATLDDPFGDTLGSVNYATIGANIDLDEYAYLDFHNLFYKDSPRASMGMLSVIPTGIQRVLPGETLKFQPSAGASELPDWLLLDLLAPTVMPQTYRHSTAGKVNINAGIAPAVANLSRWLPLQAVFQNMRSDSTVAPGASTPSQLVQNILDHRLSGSEFGAPGRFDYIGEICEVLGVADTGSNGWEREMLIRNLANLFTTQSNSFRIWGVSQTVRKNPKNTNYAQFESGDTVTGENRFSAIVERSVWAGVDGIPGNAQVDSAGAYNSLATGGPTTASPWSVPWERITQNYSDRSAATLAVVDGPHAPTYAPVGAFPQVRYQQTDEQSAYNPVAPRMRYHVLSFRNLNE